MSILRERFIQDLKLSGRSERTIECYVRHIKKLAYFYHRSPDLIDEEELRKYLLYMKDEKHYSENLVLNEVKDLSLLQTSFKCLSLSL